MNRRGPIAAFLKGIHILIDDAVRSMMRQVNLVMVVVLMHRQNEICRDIIAFSGERDRYTRRRRLMWSGGSRHGPDKESQYSRSFFPYFVLS